MAVAHAGGLGAHDHLVQLVHRLWTCRCAAVYRHFPLCCPYSKWDGHQSDVETGDGRMGPPAERLQAGKAA
jgi:hypothetical protein